MQDLAPKTLTFSFNPFATLVESFKAIGSASLKLWNLNQEHPLKKKKGFSGQIIIKLRLWQPLIEVIELPSFGRYLTASAIYFESSDQFLLVTSWREIMTLYHLFQNIFILRRPIVVIFADIIKIVTMFIKAIFKDLKKLKE